MRYAGSVVSLKQLFNPKKSFAPPLPRPAVPVRGDCSYYHITHWKAASQWMRAILAELFGAALVQPEYFQRQIWSRPPAPGLVYPCAYLAKAEYDSFATAATRHLVLVRDLRDTLVSGYFSMRFTHENTVGEMDLRRQVLNRLNPEDGMLYLCETWLNNSAWIQRSWVLGSTDWRRVEDCFRDPFATLDQMFRTLWKLEIEPATLRRAVEACAFERLSGGRQPGQEDRKSHYRRGTAGNWREYFTPRIAKRFAQLHGELLIAAGYERDESWVGQCADSAALAAIREPKT